MSHDLGGPTQMFCAHYKEKTGSKDIDKNLIRVKKTLRRLRSREKSSTAQLQNALNRKSRLDESLQRVAAKVNEARS